MPAAGVSGSGARRSVMTRTRHAVKALDEDRAGGCCRSIVIYPAKRQSNDCAARCTAAVVQLRVGMCSRLRRHTDGLFSVCNGWSDRLNSLKADLDSSSSRIGCVEVCKLLKVDLAWIG